MKIPSAVFGTAVVLLMSVLATAVEAAPCHDKAMDLLREASPGGFSLSRQVKDKRFFRIWLDCEDPLFGLPTAVHESVHFITGETDAYPLVGGGIVPRPEHDPALMAPARIAPFFKRGNLYVTTYLRPGGASSASEFRYLLDELNAYTHDLDTALHLLARRPNDDGEASHRDGLAATMAFVALYAQTAEETEAATWAALHRPALAEPLKQIWSGAEATMSRSCGIRQVGHEDQSFLRQLCGRKAQGSLTRLLGRPAECPSACLQPDGRTADTR